MKVIIIGAGRRGLRLARHLIEEKAAVTFLDISGDRCQSALAKLDCMAVCGSATNIERLVEAGVEEADTVIAVTDSDEVNLVSCGLVTASFPNVTKTVAAIRSISYLSEDEGGTSLPVLGISDIVNPDSEAARRIVDVVRSGLYYDTITFPDTNFLLFTIHVSRKSAFANLSLIEFRSRFTGNIVVTGILRKGKVILPSGDTVLRPGDDIAVICDSDDTLEFFDLGGKSSRPKDSRRTILVGATKVTRALLTRFTAKERSVSTLIERDAQTADEFSRLFPDVLVINGSITDESLWEDEALDDSDILISLTENDELNIITASYAKKLGVDRSIALIKTNPNYISLARQFDIDAPISTTEATVDTIVKHLRSGRIMSLHTLFDGKLEVYEYSISGSFRHLGKALKEVNLRGQAIIAGVKRPGADAFVPGGNYVFREGDTVLICCLHSNSSFVQELFR
ncbi:MAG: Trk system potassium transporter TrkA [Bullifex sp.]